MSTLLSIQPRSNRARLNRLPVASQAKFLPSETTLKAKKEPKPSKKPDMLSPPTSLDTTIDESFSRCSKDAISLSSLNQSHGFDTQNDLDSRSMSSIENIEDRCTILNSALQHKRKAVPDDTKYKTEICKKWVQTGKCPYNKKCKFAHGKHELHEKALNNKASYRSKRCASFHTKLFCPYGIRCLFAHEQRTLEGLLNEGFFNMVMGCDIYPLKNRLPAFSKQGEGEDYHMNTPPKAQKSSPIIFSSEEEGKSDRMTCSLYGSWEELEGQDDLGNGLTASVAISSWNCSPIQN